MTRASDSRLAASGSSAELPAFGRLLREWRTLRRRSQLELALEAEVSARHVSFVETGRAQPSREMVLLLVAPDGLRPHVANWAELARDVLARVRREAAFEGDRETHALLAELVQLAGVAPDRTEALPDREAMVIPVEIAVGGTVLRFFTTVTTLGAPQDLTLAELRIEAFHARDAATEAAMRAMGER